MFNIRSQRHRRLKAAGRTDRRDHSLWGIDTPAGVVTCVLYRPPPSVGDTDPEVGYLLLIVPCLVFEEFAD